MKLSVLICTIHSRAFEFQRLCNFLNHQLGDNEEVEVLFEIDNKEISVGAKRQKLLERAKGEYVVWIDDDDWTHEYYTDHILQAIESKPDCVGFRIKCKGTPGKTASASNRFDDWAEKVDGFDYVRTIYHKTPVKREHALAIGFKDMRFGEDYDYSKRLKESGLLQDEVFIDEELYIYQYKFENSKTKYGIKD